MSQENLKEYRVVIELDVTAENEQQTLDYAVQDIQACHKEDTLTGNITELK